MDIQVEKLRARLNEIDGMISQLEEEAEEITVALRVIDRYVTEKKEETSGEGRGRPRPDGIPTIFEMVGFVLKDAGSNGLSGQEIIERIRARYWPGLASQQIMPSAYRFVKEGRLEKRGAKFFLANKHNGSASLSLTHDGA